MDESFEATATATTKKTPEVFAANNLSEALKEYGLSDDVSTAEAYKYVSGSSREGLPTLRYMNMKLMAATIYIIMRAGSVADGYANSDNMTTVYQKLYGVTDMSEVSRARQDKTIASMIRYESAINAFKSPQ